MGSWRARGEPGRRSDDTRLFYNRGRFRFPVLSHVPVTSAEPIPVKFILDNWYLIFAALASGGLLLWPTLQGKRGGGVGTLEATQLINRGATLLDVRTADEFKRGHIAGSKHIPVDQIAARAGEVAKNKDNPVVVVCQSGGRSASACATLRKQGYTQVLNLQGGIGAWQSANLPLTTK